jgi:hypothetical protein
MQLQVAHECCESAPVAGFARPGRRPPSERVYPVLHPLPLHHTTVVLSVVGQPPSWTARILFLSGPHCRAEPYGTLVEYMLFHRTLSRTWQDTIARALGLLWDFCQVKGPLLVDESKRADLVFRPMLLREFAQVLIGGTVIHGDDPSGLFWPPTTPSRATMLINAIEKFSEWCTSRRRDLSVADSDDVPDRSPSFTDLLVYGRVRQVSMLAHIKKLPPAAKKSVASTIQKPRGEGVEPVKHFPAVRAIDLLWVGYARRGHERMDDFFKKYCVRDIMIALLCGWGGMRRSEPLHLWVQDVVEHPKDAGHAVVVLNHPSAALVEIDDPLGGRSFKTTRRDALNRKYGLEPRNVAVRGRYSSGWKSLNLDQNLQAQVLWFDKEAAALFWALYVGYLHHVRAPIMAKRRAAHLHDHPYLFVSEGDARRDGKVSFGEPYSGKAYERNHDAAVRRIGLDPGKEAGTTTHSMRHMYGQALSDLNLPPQVIKMAMRHRNYLSQVVYTAPTFAKASEILNEAAKAFKEGRPVGRSEPTENATATALFRLSEHITGGGER